MKNSEENSKHGYAKSTVSDLYLISNKLMNVMKEDDGSYEYLLASIYSRIIPTAMHTSNCAIDREREL